MANIKNETGNVYGLLTVVEKYPFGKGGKASWKCKCNKCGNISIVSGDNLRNGHTKSCKCSRFIPSYKKHGLSYSRIYKIWIGMKTRCFNSKDKVSYPLYGAKGIVICDRWLRFENFYEDMFPSYREGLTIDRIDNEKGYSPENCRWATYKEQIYNKKKSVKKLTYNGITKYISDWSREYGVSYSKISHRIKRKQSLDNLFIKI